MSTISASTTSTTAYKVTADTTGTLVLQTGATPTTAVTIGSDQSTTLAGTLNLAGQNMTPYTGFKNRIINGAMMIDQRNAGASVTPSDAAYTVDRWQYGATQASKFTAQQNAGSVTPPTGFKNYLGMTVASAVSVGAGDIFQILQSIEGFNAADLGWGAAGASTVTLSFWVRSSLTGTFGGALTNSAFNRAYPFTYTISAANTWEQKTVTIAGDTSGTWLTTNGIGISVRFGLGVGSTYSGTAGSWSGTGYVSATGATSVVGTNAATFYITGVQLEKGTTATSFDYRPYTTEFQLCQRYLPAWSGNGLYGMGVAANSTDAYINLPFIVPPRVAPTGITVSAGNAFIVSDITSSFNTTSSVAFSQSSLSMLAVKAVSAGQVANRPVTMQGNAAGSLIYGTGCEL